MDRNLGVNVGVGNLLEFVNANRDQMRISKIDAFFVFLLMRVYMDTPNSQKVKNGLKFVNANRDQMRISKIDAFFVFLLMRVYMDTHSSQKVKGMLEIAYIRMSLDVLRRIPANVVKHRSKCIQMFIAHVVGVDEFVDAKTFKINMDHLYMLICMQLYTTYAFKKGVGR